MAINNLSIQYDAYVQNGKIQNDSAQREVLAALQTLELALAPAIQEKPSLIKKLFQKPQEIIPAKSIYIWGGVGRGKSMLMDLFFENIAMEGKRRVHFHAFMQEIHARIHHFRQDGIRDKRGTDPVMRLTKEIASDTKLLCFDELQATDVADATLLFRLFDGLFDAGVIIVSTSNRPTESIYTGGIQGERFTKFIALLNLNMQIISLSSPKDYRHLQIKSLEQIYYYPLGSEAERFIEKVIAKICKNPHPSHASVTVHGRKLPFNLYDDFIGQFRFDDLCGAALGPADYLAIAKRLDTLILSDIPKLKPEQRNEAKRFVTLIDALYEHKVKLITTAAVAAEFIYSEGDGSFEFARTVSRLAEMQSAKWIEHG